MPAVGTVVVGPAQPGYTPPVIVGSGLGPPTVQVFRVAGGSHGQDEYVPKWLVGAHGGPGADHKLRGDGRGARSAGGAIALPRIVRRRPVDHARLVRWR